MFRILIVDDNEADLNCTAMVLAEDTDFKLTLTTSPEQAISFVKQDPGAFAAVLLDYQMPMDGVSLARELLKINSQLSVAILSADQSREALKRCIAHGIRDFIDKDQEEETIRSIVRGLCQKWEQRPQVFRPSRDKDQNEKLISTIGVVGRSKKLAEIALLVKKIGKVEANIFLQGESGVGKERVAKAIHAASPRSSGPFVAINVAAIPENLAESELFGHVRGAFSSADRANEGKLLAANGGTLFLDEIGDLKPDLQVKLLRVLQERKVTPVGSSKESKLDVRLITATHVDLEQAILDGSFREDLYYRLHVIPIVIPPLRDRPEDIEPLVTHFLDVFGHGEKQMLDKTVRVLERYHWKGNVRELENEVQRLVAICGKVIEPKHLNDRIRNACGVEGDELAQSYSAFMAKIHETELEFIESNIRKFTSLREACRLYFKLPASSIHTRIKTLEQYLTKTKFQEAANAE